MIGTTIKRIRKIIINSINLFGNFKRLVNKLVDKKLELIEHHLTLLQSPDYAAQFSRDRGFSPKLIKVLIKFGVAFFKIKKWWLSIHMESQSRVASAEVSEVMWYQKRWAEQVIFDNYYNEHFLTVAPPTFVPHINSREI